MLQQDLQDDGRDGEELPGSRELDPIVHLLPVGEQASLALVGCLEGRPFDSVQQQVHALQRHSGGGFFPPLVLHTSSPTSPKLRPRSRLTRL